MVVLDLLSAALRLTRRESPDSDVGSFFRRTFGSIGRRNQPNTAPATAAPSTSPAVENFPVAEDTPENRMFREGLTLPEQLNTLQLCLTERGRGFRVVDLDAPLIAELSQQLFVPDQTRTVMLWKWGGAAPAVNIVILVPPDPTEPNVVQIIVFPQRIRTTILDDYQEASATGKMGMISLGQILETNSFAGLEKMIAKSSTVAAPAPRTSPPIAVP